MSAITLRDTTGEDVRAYVLCENESAADAFIALCQERGDNSAYSDDGGWERVEFVLEELSKPLTADIVRNMHEQHGEDFDVVLLDEGFIWEDEEGKYDEVE